MKHALLLTFGFALTLEAQYVLDWHAVAGGGAASTGSVYSISGTVGQPDAGRSGGETYSVMGGFWSLVAAVQPVGAPTLRIELRSMQVILAWTNPSTGFQLQETPALAAPTWMDVREPPSVVGAENQVVLPSQPGNRFFRLRRP